MRTPLAAALVGLLALAASAAAPPSADEADFDKRFKAAVAKAAQAFLDGEPLPKLDLPKEIATQLKTADYLENYATLVAQASYVQQGRAPEDDENTYRAMIVHVSEKLLVSPEKALQRYGKLQRDPSKKLDPLAEPALRAGLIYELMRSHALPPDAEKQMKAKLDAARKSLEALGGGLDADAVIRNTSSKYFADAKTSPEGAAAGKPYWWKKVVVPSGLESPAPSSRGGFWGWLDNSLVGKLVREVKENVVGFIGYCYRYVAMALDAILPASWRKDVQLASAYQFATSLNSNPKLFDKLKLRKVDPAEIPDGVPPIGAIIVYHKGTCGFHPIHGHIEIVTSKTPPQACSDGCMAINENRRKCIREKGPLGLVNVYVPVRS